MRRNDPIVNLHVPHTRRYSHDNSNSLSASHSTQSVECCEPEVPKRRINGGSEHLHTHFSIFQFLSIHLN
ncbi:hypothetical protein M758_2G249300 [Ceratodon purpureus]|nr:hypothetical protein M758_2G249200 [Ceratodon purpureus]KAG0628097.1 hypothetical protein M758_2G249300 [Ceratodon purpureus]